MQRVMINAARTLMRTHVPTPRIAAPGARRRLLAHLPVVLQTAAAAAGAWYLALLLLPSPRPAFAAIAAVISLAATYGQRRRQATELVGGVLLGIIVATGLLALIGTGPLQIALRRHARHERGAAAARRRGAGQRGGGHRDPAGLAARQPMRASRSSASSRASSAAPSGLRSPRCCCRPTPS